ncbi:MAG: 4'-phosphopantetheinyl transferase superfamily protein [Candidatus Dormibacteria bacterium]|jgi:4'-phosphopantetheinyl transferase
MSGVRALDGDAVHLWRASLDPDPAVLTALGATLSPAERQRAARFRRPEDRRRSTAARGWLRYLLGGYLGEDAAGLVLLEDEGGKPRLQGAGRAWLRFNLSHSAEVMVVAVARDREVGVDVEEITAGMPFEAMSRRLLSERDQRFVSRAGPDRRPEAFLACWTRTEAVLKAAGLGLGVDPSTIEALPPNATLGRLGPSRVGRWALRGFDAGPGLAAAVAVEGSGVRIPDVARRLSLATVADAIAAARAPATRPR